MIFATGAITLLFLPHIASIVSVRNAMQDRRRRFLVIDYGRTLVAAVSSPVLLVRLVPKLLLRNLVCVNLFNFIIFM